MVIKKRVLELVMLSFALWTQKTWCPESLPITVRQIQQALLTIKRNASNLEQILRRANTPEAFYAAPQTPQQLMELTEASLFIKLHSGYFKTH